MPLHRLPRFIFCQNIISGFARCSRILLTALPPRISATCFWHLNAAYRNGAMAQSRSRTALRYATTFATRLTATLCWHLNAAFFGRARRQSYATLSHTYVRIRTFNMYAYKPHRNIYLCRFYSHSPRFILTDAVTANRLRFGIIDDRRGVLLCCWRYVWRRDDGVVTKPDGIDETCVVLLLLYCSVVTGVFVVTDCYDWYWWLLWGGGGAMAY